MTIGIILHPYGEYKLAGLGRAIYEIARSLIEADRNNHYILYLHRKPKILPVFSGTNWEIKVIGRRFFWLDIGLWRENLDVCIFNTPVMPFFVRPKKSIVITYDYAYRYFEKSWGLALLHRFSLRRADRVIAVSEHTKNETVRLFGVSEKKVSVVYLGFKNFCEGVAKTENPLSRRFFLFVGVIKERKNVLGVIKAFRAFKEKTRSSSYVLVIAGWGSGLYFDRVTHYIKEHGLEKSVIIDQTIVDNALIPYYRHAEALLYPSFIEGFGFPVLEAFSCGLPVITSNTSSLPEVAGDAALLVDPHKPAEIAAAMGQIVSERDLRAALILRGFAQTKKFSWEKTAREYLGVIHSV